MKKLLLFSFFALVAFVSNAQHDMNSDKAKMPSPPAVTVAKIGGTTLEIKYSQPGVKGRNVWAGSLSSLW